MRSIISPDTAETEEDLLERLLACETEIVGLIRRDERDPNASDRSMLELSVYGAGMLEPAELRQRLRGCDVIFQDIYSFAGLQAQPLEDDLSRVAWRAREPVATRPGRHAAIREDVFLAPDATVRLYRWAAGQAGGSGDRAKLEQPFLTDDLLSSQLRRHTLEVTLVVPARVSSFRQDAPLEELTRLRGVLTELLDYWAELKLPA